MEQLPSTGPVIGRRERHLREKRRRKRRLRLTLLIIFTLLAAVVVSSWYRFQPVVITEPKNMYFYSLLAEDIDGWEGIDASVIEDEERGQPGVVRLARKEYAAPHLRRQITLQEAPPGANFVWHFPVYVSAFTDEAVVLGALFFPAGPLAVVVNGQGQLGIARDLFETPLYTETRAGRMAFDRWEEIYVYVNGAESEIVLYLNDKRVLTETWEAPAFPVLDIWLGALWLRGAGNYGAPLDISYTSVALFDDEALSEVSFISYLLNQVVEFLDLIKQRLKF